MIEDKGIHISRPQTNALSTKQLQQINVFPSFFVSDPTEDTHLAHQAADCERAGENLQQLKYWNIKHTYEGAYLYLWLRFTSKCDYLFDA